MEIGPPQRSGEELYIECRGWHDWPLGPWGRYLSLRSVQHQIIEFAEDALLQLVPGDASVLMHEKWRAKPEEDEEKEKKEEHQGRRGWLRLSGWFTFFFFFYMKHTCCDQEALLISWWHLARLLSRIWKKNQNIFLWAGGTLCDWPRNKVVMLATADTLTTSTHGCMAIKFLDYLEQKTLQGPSKYFLSVLQSTIMSTSDCVCSPA